jgi:hypothetical protein
MMSSKALENDLFQTVLGSAGRSAEIPESADLYGWLIGSWDLDVLRYWAVDVSARGIKAEAHFVWVLEGRAVQDLWIMPRRSDRAGSPDKKMNMYGTTLRAWDPSIQAWRITWINPAGGHFEQQIGRRSGNDIVQIGVRPDGTTTRWRFTEITRDSFHWLGESLQTDGNTWTLEGEFRAQRMA